MIISNRGGLDNFKLELLESGHVEKTEGYIILQDRGEEGNVAMIGLWIFAEPETSSTVGTREQAARVIADCAVRGENTRAAVESGAPDTGLDTGRGLSSSDQAL